MTKSWPSYKAKHPIITNPHSPLCPVVGNYRKNVGCLVIRKQEDTWLLLLGQRRDTPGFWQWPQGGCEEGESPQVTLKRELKEEVGLSQYKVAYQYPFFVRYNFPAKFRRRFPNHVGQEQLFFIVQPMEEPGLDKATDKEFSELAWMPIEAAVKQTVWFKKSLYACVVEHLEKVLAASFEESPSKV